MSLTNIEISQPKCIDGRSLLEWLCEFLSNNLPDKEIYLLPDTPHDFTGESGFFCNIDVDRHINKDELLSKICNISTDKTAYFYVQDVVEAACGDGVLDDSHYHVLFK
ncbi:hypothetical protein NDJ00_23725 [Vibrio parahaemolyticus]|uniref:Uncharacterized protein n=1 Tax=Vibrio cholerae TaxID=666 RepID=A0A5Q6PCL3_VIBCL|nr:MULTISPECIES: hypothetical protein [Vibrio]KAA1252553.1 hypothetical protein F0M16_22265 [Vibrio cholerae]KOY41144.1 hypothetical protein ACX10_02225 [Vibrio parahaemolyticus]MCS0117191.1 hypothetical protein [Vibrio parahaemolyticus]